VHARMRREQTVEPHAGSIGRAVLCRRLSNGVRVAVKQVLCPNFVADVAYETQRIM
jgi:hypothetical protein